MLLADDVLEADLYGAVLEALRTCLSRSIRVAQNTERIQDIVRGFLPRIQDLADLTQNRNARWILYYFEAGDGE